MRNIRNVAYGLGLFASLASVHPIFHVSMLKKYVGDNCFMVPAENLGVNDSLSYEEVPLEILDHQVQKLMTKDIA